MSAIQKTNNTKSATLSLHDPEFKNLITVPLAAVHHMPPAHLEISRLVLCRKYDPRDPVHSCPMGEGCKFVHIDMSCPQLTVQSIHVNYAYRSLAEVTHDRLPAGETLAVMAPNNRAPSQLVPSEMVLATRGATQRHNAKGPLSHCAHYFYNRMCNRGDRCGFIHALYIDENATEFQRAPPRAGASNCCSTSAPAVPAQSRPTAVPALPKADQLAHSGSSLSTSSSNDLSESPRSERSAGLASTTASTYTRRMYRRNPYSLIETTLSVEQV